MKFKPWEAILDIFCILRLRVKLICRDITTILVLCISILLFAVLIRTLTVSAGDLSSLPVGVIDQDNSVSSRQLISGLSKSETLRIVTGSEKKLHKQLLDEMIASVFVINKGYENNLKEGKLDDIITIYYKEDNKSASILADIVAGEVMYPACLYKSFRYYDRLSPVTDKLTIERYKSYMDGLVGSSSDFDFAFRIFYRNPLSSQSTKEPISNSVLYNQFIFGILGIMIAFIAMFILSQTVSEKENRVDVRLKISGFHILKRDIGNLCAVLSCEGLVSVLFTELILGQLKTEDRRLWLSIYLLILLNAFVLGGIMLLAAKLIHRMLLYQLFSSAMILLTGGLGFYHMLTGFYQGMLDNLVKFIPNSWLIRGFTDIMIYGREGGYLKEGHYILIIMAIAVISLVTIIDLIQERHFAGMRRTGN